MSNTENIRLPIVQYGKNNVRSHVLNGCFRLDQNYSCIIIYIIAPTGKMKWFEICSAYFPSSQVYEGLLLKSRWAITELYNSENKLFFGVMMMISVFY